MWPTQKASEGRHAFSQEPTPRTRASNGLVVAFLGRLVVGFVVAAVPMGLALALVLMSATARQVQSKAALKAVTATVAAEDEVELPTVQSRERRFTDTPDTVEEVLELEQQILATVEKAIPTTVALRLSNGQGSGVIVSPDGLVLTAAHVINQPNSPVAFIMPDGTTYRGRTLGRVRSLDAGMAIIDDSDAPVPFDFAEIGTSDDLETGTWTVATGHPAGFQEQRPPVVRVGRLNRVTDSVLQSDNTLVGGDSGGPLFDLEGRLVGIHSRIGQQRIGTNVLAGNVHIPIDRFIDNWQPMRVGRDTGGIRLPNWMRMQVADDGIRLDLGPSRGNDDGSREGDGSGVGSDGRPGATVRMVVDGSPAATAEIRIGDRIVAVGDAEIESETDLLALRPTFRVGQSVQYRVVDQSGVVRDVSVTLAGFDRDGSDRSAPQSRPYRGLMGVNLNNSFSGGDAAVIGGVTPGSPADEAGIRPGDRIVSLRGQRIYDFRQVQQALANGRPGDMITLQVASPGEEARRIRLQLASADELQELEEAR
ncbi:MAG: trypsin-like peptidase domain-containing protein [Planctomycetota bacterium]